MIALAIPPTEPPFTTGLTPWAQTLPQHISPTAAKSYLSCGLRFWFERVACIRKPTTPALHLGKAVHAALQAFHLARWRGGDDSVEAVADAYERAFLRLEREEGPVNFDDATEREKCRLDGLRVVAAYLDSPEAMKEKPRAVEVLLKEDIPGLSVPSPERWIWSKAISHRSISNRPPPSPTRQTRRSITKSSSSVTNC
jgi:putative RecB family exonuclease